MTLRLQLAASNVYTALMSTLRLPGRFESLPKIGEFVVKAARAAGLDERAVYAVELAVDEACSNIIDHAYGGEGIGDLECEVSWQEDKLIIILRDFGKPFDPEAIPDPKIGVSIDELKPRGVGFFLMKKMMDEIRYSYTPESGNTLTMIKQKLST